MNKVFDARQAYIHNITSLWKTAASPFDGLVEYPAFSYCAIKGMQWPNRLWFHQDINAESLDQAFATVPDIRKLKVPYWDVYGTGSWKILESKGYVNIGEVTSMSLALKEHFQPGYQLHFKQVKEATEAAIWSTTFFQSFGYVLTPAILMQTLPAIHYYVVYDQSKPVGTAELFINGTVAGIHSIGVVPAMRRRGFANVIMRFILNRAIELNCTHAVLHASNMGKDIYLKLGFEDEFLIKNYNLPTAAS
jgi:ribosomal protein S18 acetylase RimI-like enzyme